LSKNDGGINGELLCETLGDIEWTVCKAVPARNDPDDLTLLSDNGNGALVDDDVNMAAAGNLGMSTLGIPKAGIDVVLALDERRLRSPQAKYEG